jgi:hypothetical protein
LARKDDYENAFKLAAEELAAKDPHQVGQLAGVVYDEDKRALCFDFVGRPTEVSWPEMSVRFSASEDEVPLTDRVLILHYLNQAKGAPLANEMITYREVPSGTFYLSAFIKRAEKPMLAVFGEQPELLLEAAPQLGGQPVEGLADAAARFQVLPMVPVTLMVWGGDDEFPPEGKILFDKNISHYLTTEDVAWAASAVVYRLMRMVPRKG